MKLLTRIGVRTYLRHPAQSALSVLGIALGVAIVLAIDLTTVGAERAFELSAQSVGGRATHEIAAGSAGFDESLYRELRVELGVSTCAPVVGGTARRIEGGALGDAFQIVGVDLFAEGPLRPYFAYGTEETGEGFDMGRFLTEPGACAVAQDAGFEVGESIEVECQGRRTRFVVVSHLRPRDPLVVRGLRNVILADVSTVQPAVGRLGLLDRIDLVLDDDEEAERSRRALPPDVELRSVAERRAALADLTRAFRFNLSALGMLTLLVGAFLIYNTVSFAVVQRRRSLGVLRAIGASRTQIFRSVLTEALVLGALGTVTGLVLGVVLAHSLLDIVTRTIQDHYFTVSVTSVDLSLGDVAVVIGLGLATCVVAALAPAWDATRVSAREAMSHSRFVVRSEGRISRGVFVAVAASSFGATVLWLGSGVATAYVGLFALLLAAAAMTPWFCVVVAKAAGPVCRGLFGAVGTYAARGVSRSLSRTAVAVAALMLAVATTVGLGSMIGSFRGGVERWLHTALPADVYLSAPATISERFRVGLEPEIVRRVPEIEGVADAIEYRRFEVDGRAGGGGGDLGAVRCIALRGLDRVTSAFEPIEGDPDVIVRDFTTGRGVMISEPFGYRLGLERGDVISLRGRDGFFETDVVGVFRDYGSETGYLVMARSLHEARFAETPVSAFSVFAAEGVDPDELADRIVTELAGAAAGQRLTCQSSRGLREASLDVFDRTFAVTAAMRVLCVVVAFLGIWSALMSLQLERRREIGVLRALGAVPAQVRAIVTTQTGLLGVAAGLWALPVGAMLGWVLVYVINKRSFGWTLLSFGVPVSVVVEAIVVAVLAALLAGVIPARAFARTNVSRALRED